MHTTQHTTRWHGRPARARSTRWHGRPARARSTRWHGRPARARSALRNLRAFTILEMQIAILISALLFTAMLTALDSMFKGFETNADAASSNVVTRLVVNRVLSMVRTGSDFRPWPDDVLDTGENPLFSDYMEFISRRDDTTGAPIEVVRIEFRYPGAGALNRRWGVAEEEPPLPDDVTPGPGELWMVRTDLTTSVETEALLIDRVRACLFTLEYDIGPTLERATMDITADPAQPEAVRVSTDAPPPALRMVASAMPRRAGN